MVVIKKRELFGVWQVHLEGKFEFLCRCYDAKDGVKLSDLKKNECLTAAKFQLFPKPGQKDLPSWVKKTPDGVHKPIEVDQWGPPYNAFTAEVDKEMWIPTRFKKDRKKIVWRLCSDIEDTCTWVPGSKKDISWSKEYFKVSKKKKQIKKIKKKVRKSARKTSTKKNRRGKKSRRR